MNVHEICFSMLSRVLFSGFCSHRFLSPVFLMNTNMFQSIEISNKGATKKVVVHGIYLLFNLFRECISIDSYFKDGLNLPQALCILRRCLDP